MAKVVREIMNSELFSLRGDDSLGDALSYLLALGISAAPVLDNERRPIGLMSLKDAHPLQDDVEVQGRMTRPVLTVAEDTLIEDAASIVAERGVHRVVVVDDNGTAVGVASSLDLIAGLLGLPAKHPAAFPHYDREHGVTWTDDTALELATANVAPNEAGVLVLVAGGKGQIERTVWAEASYNVRTRIYDLLARPQTEQPELQRVLDTYRGRLRFRACALASEDARIQLAESLLSRTRGLPHQEPRVA
jgi:CBS domain-containing protein